MLLLQLVKAKPSRLLRTVSIMNSLQIKVFSSAMHGLQSLFEMLFKSAFFDLRVSSFKFTEFTDASSDTLLA